MKILITGVNGFIGSNIYNGLKKNHNILGISQSMKSKICDNYISCDLTNREHLEKVIKENNDIDVIVHCAALAHNKGNDLSKERFKKVNYEVTKYLVDLSNKYLKLEKFIFLSTISVYGERMEKSVYIESDKCFPKSPYAVAKKKSEEYITANCESQYFMLRLAPVYSNTFRLNIQRRTEIKGVNYIVGKGNNKLSLCNVKNIVDVIGNIMDGSVNSNEIYNISDESPYTFKDMLYINKVSKFRIFVPKFAINMLYVINKSTIKKQFIDENSIKLVTDNIYSSEKLRKYIKLEYNLKH
ncbi:MAG: NAD-dependent epimerase/dehydratase family protein [Peptostreptococcaceae bacterium]